MLFEQAGSRGGGATGTEHQLHERVPPGCDLEAWCPGLGRYLEVVLLANTLANGELKAVY